MTRLSAIRLVACLLAFQPLAALATPTDFAAHPITSAASLHLETKTIATRSGYCARVIVENTGSATERGWSVRFRLGPNKLLFLVGAKYKVDDDEVIVSSWRHGFIKPGKARQFVFCTKGSHDPAPFVASATVAGESANATLLTSFTVKDKGDSNYCAKVTIRNKGPGTVRDWRLVFDLGTDQLTFIRGGEADKETGLVTVTPNAFHRTMRKHHKETIRFCASRRTEDPCTVVPEPEPVITIVSPAPNAQLESRTVFVSGTYSGPPNTGVTVNGVVAHTDGRFFYANRVPLESGTNILKATATTPFQQTAENEITVETSASGELDLWVSPRALGFAPVAVTFRVIGGAAAQAITADFDNNGTIDYSSADTTLAIDHTYTVPGLYVARFTVTDATGSPRELSYAIDVPDKAQLDERLRSVFRDLNRELTCERTDQAVKLIRVHARERYAPVFTALQPNFREIVDSYSPLQQALLASTFGEYAINRTIDGVNRLFFIYFMQDDDGVWRVDSM